MYKGLTGLFNCSSVANEKITTNEYRNLRIFSLILSPALFAISLHLSKGAFVMGVGTRAFVNRPLSCINVEM
jgi:hypothetical protein